MTSAFDEFLIAFGDPDIVPQSQFKNKKLTISEELKLYRKFINDFYNNQQ